MSKATVLGKTTKADLPKGPDDRGVSRQLGRVCDDLALSVRELGTQNHALMEHPYPSPSRV
jgi:hypothetical protein